MEDSEGKKAFSLINWLSNWTIPAAIYHCFNIFLPLSSITAYTHSCAPCVAQWQRGLPLFSVWQSSIFHTRRIPPFKRIGWRWLRVDRGHSGLPSGLKCYDQSWDYGSKSPAEFWLRNRDHSCMGKHNDNTNITQGSVFQPLTRDCLHAQRIYSTHRWQVESEWRVWCAKITVLASLTFCTVGAKSF